MMGRRLVVQHGERVNRHEISDKAILVGCDPGCDLFFADLKLSHRHARIEPGSQGLALVDLESRNGSWVNEERIVITGNRRRLPLIRRNVKPCEKAKDEPMSLPEQIQKDLIQAMKSRDALRVSVLRMMKTALKNREIEKGKELSEQECIQTLKTQLKQRTEAIQQFEAGGRQDLAAKERQEKALIEAYLPEPVSADEMGRVISEVFREKSAAGLRDMGTVMRETMARLQATGKTVDGKAASQLVRAQLDSLETKDSD
jgi:uncharacterized protein YqeY